MLPLSIAIDAEALIDAYCRELHEDRWNVSTNAFPEGSCQFEVEEEDARVVSNGRIDDLASLTHNRSQFGLSRMHAGYEGTALYCRQYIRHRPHQGGAKVKVVDEHRNVAAGPNE